MSEVRSNPTVSAVNAKDHAEISKRHQTDLRGKTEIVVNKLREKRNKKHDELRIGHLKRDPLQPERALLFNGH